MRQPQLREQLLGARLDLLPRQLADIRVQHDVVERGSKFEQQVVLERDADVGDRLGHGRAADDDVAMAACSNPATISISVLLPQPDGPTTETNSPAAMSTLTSFSARNGLSRVLAESLRHAADPDRNAGLVHLVVRASTAVILARPPLPSAAPWT